MSKTYIIPCLVQGLCMGLFVICFKDYIESDSGWSLLFTYIFLSGILTTNRLIMKEDRDE